MIIFSHANSFPASTYQVLFKNLQARGFAVKAIEKFGHDPRFAVTDNWPQLVQQLADFVQPQVEETGEKVWLVGHSLGGFLSLMLAAQRPELAKGVLMIDAPFLSGWKSTALGVLKGTSLASSFGPGRVSRQRRFSWDSIDAAYAHFRYKKAFAKWDGQVLLDYVTHGTLEHDGKRVLAFDRDVETRIYNTLPDNLDRLVKKHPLKCPVSFIGGCDSWELKKIGLARTESLTKGRIMMLDGSHLFPMERPLATAAAIEASLRNMGLVGRDG
jgi:pimeloyl-ACP methyl ester carboxylesterase